MDLDAIEPDQRDACSYSHRCAFLPFLNVTTHAAFAIFGLRFARRCVVGSGSDATIDPRARDPVMRCAMDSIVKTLSSNDL